MSILKINHNEASGGGNVTPGTYQAEVSKAQVKKSSNGNPMIELTFKIRKDVEQPHGGRIVFDRLVLTEDSMWKVQLYAKALGLPDGLEVETYEELATYLKDRKAEITVGEREYNGKTYAQVNKVEPAFDADDSGVSDDPFSGGGEIDLSDEDLPF